MRDIKVASRYANSLLKIAIEDNALEALHNDMVLVHDVCTNNNDLVLLLRSPIVKSYKKKEVVDAIFGTHLSKISSTFISLIITKKREGILSDIASSFIDIYKIHKNIKSATVSTAVPLTKEQKDSVTAILNATEGTENVALTEVVDPSLIGGMILRVGDKQIDESIKRKLTNLEMEFDETPYIKEI
jgi:F-type H+-transporting ATPase subunit delta